MISWKLKRWRMLGVAAALTLAACGQTATQADDDTGAPAPAADDNGEAAKAARAANPASLEKAARAATAGRAEGFLRTIRI